MLISYLAVLFAGSLSLAQPLDLSESSLNHARQAVNQLEARWENKGNCVAHLRTTEKSTHCGVGGALAHKFPGSVNHDWTYNHCANDCVCKGDSCKSFSWRENKKDGKGECIQHHLHLYEMKFAETNVDSRKWYDRTCFHRAKPTPAGVHTNLAPLATPAPRRRDVDLDSALVMAMAG